MQGSPKIACLQEIKIKEKKKKEYAMSYLYDIETPVKIKITLYEQKAYDKIGHFFQPNELDVLTLQYCL